MAGKMLLTTQKFEKLLRENRTDFSGAVFKRGTDICFMNLEGLNFKNADMQQICMHKAIFKNANMESVNLFHSDISYADFTNANLRKTGFSHGVLRNVNLTGAKIVDSAMCGTDLRTAIGVGSCDFNNTYFSGTIVTARQKESILSRYKVLKGPIKRGDEKRPFIRASEDEMAFKVMTLKAKR